MDIVIAATIVFYLLSSATYLAFLLSQKKNLDRVALCLFITGFLCHLTSVGYDFTRTGQIPVHNLYQTLSLSALAVAVIFIVFHFKFKLKVLGVFAAPFAALIMLAAYQLPRVPVQANALFNSFWFVVHILSIFIGEGALAMACGVGILYILQENSIKSKKRGFFYDRLPSLDLLDTTGYGSIVVGFIMLTLGLVTGFVYAKSAWGRFWSWDPKEIWAVATWLIYAALFHQRLTVGWRGRRAAIMAIIGFLAILFTFIGVNFLLPGHHGQFTN
ncbi:MAG: c-type cytochrome biogenesis protein CcsB [Desulfobacterales bacterium]|nr:c-type cytochrome biogenesis protein CcsB [Desulfobacterales bacterium]